VKYKCPNCGEVDEKDVVWLIEDLANCTLAGYCPRCYERIAEKHVKLGEWFLLAPKTA
jgi:hypothetical protein